MNKLKSINALWSIFILLMITVFSLVTYIACEKNDDTIRVVYAESQCDNAWQRGETDTETANNIRTYLAQHDIITFGITFLRISNGPFCDACNCWYGRLIYVNVLEQDLEKIKDLGFYLDQ